MKKIVLVVIGLVVLASCQEKQRYTQQSPEIDTYKNQLRFTKIKIGKILRPLMPIQQKFATM
ncbi:hypothetical protein [Flavobacterium piscinae]|uniref:hypothetical protein n=1 Tax=Flavobacterium piscinae TaxID=2506424 RepID=UPI002AAA65B3|nr:hypothetical protein [Flavobacterium piscinae]